MSNLKILWLLMAMAFIAVPSQPAPAQNRTSASVDMAATLPDSFRTQLSALDDRLKSRNKDNTILRGLFIEGQSPGRPAQVTIQVPQGLARLEGFLPGNTPVVFDGDIHSRRPRIDATLLETFAMDSVEGMIASLKNGAAARLVAQDSSPERGSKDEPHYVVYEITDVVRMDGGDAFRQKFYLFDTQTGLLAKTQYMDGRINVEVRFSNWGKVDGSLYPGQVDRLEDNQPQFSFVVSEGSAGPQKEAAGFR